MLESQIRNVQRRIVIINIVVNPSTCCDMLALKNQWFSYVNHPQQIASS